MVPSQSQPQRITVAELIERGGATSALMIELCKADNVDVTMTDEIATEVSFLSI